jgi:hypothetical protein
MATLPDSTVSGGIWEERNTKFKLKLKLKVKAKVDRNIQPQRGHVQSPINFLFLSGRRGSEGDESK